MNQVFAILIQSEQKYQIKYLMFLQSESHCSKLLLYYKFLYARFISDGGLTPTTDTDLLLATYRGGSHLTSDIKI